MISHMHVAPDELLCHHTSALTRRLHRRVEEIGNVNKETATAAMDTIQRNKSLVVGRPFGTYMERQTMTIA